MKKYLFLAAFLSISLGALSQKITGVIYDNKTKETLPSANIYWLQGGGGTISDIDGNFTIEKKKANQTKLIFSYTGYANDTVEIKDNTNLKIYLKQTGTVLSTFEVRERMKSTYLSKTSLENKEIISGEGLKHLACCNLGESFENSASVDVGYSDAVSGSKQIQLLGLTGVYSQILLENMPFLRGLSAPFGLSYVPGNWMESISVSKGVATVKHGYETITGIIDLEYDKPQKADLFSFNAYLNNELKTEFNVKANHIINDNLATGIFVYGTYNNFKSFDHLGNAGQGDGFRDYPSQTQINVANRWNYEVHDGLCSQTLINYTREERLGGQMAFAEDMRGSDSIYGLGGTVDRLHFFTKNGAHLGNTSSFGTQLSATYFKQDAYYGLTNYEGIETDVYANALVNTMVRGGHNVDFGASFRYTDVQENLYSMPYLGANLFSSNNQIGDLRTNFVKEEIVPGVFGQFNFIYDKIFVATAGVRYDYNTAYAKHIITPRLHFRWKITDDLIFRGAAGKGFRSANLIADNFGILASSRDIIIEEALEMEEAYNAGVNLSYSLPLSDDREMTIALDYYHTNFVNQVVMDLDQNPNQVHFYNLDGKSYSNAAQLDVNVEAFEGFNITLAGRYNDVKTTYHGELMEKPYVAKWKGLVVLSYKTKYDKWMFDLTTQFNGKQRIPLNVGEKQGYADPYIYMLGQITRKFKNLDIYVGVENITNHTQEVPVIGVDEIFTRKFDASVVYAPVMGRLIYAGLRWNIK
jgi:outer membrane receptor for ferrienterochelin and colicin